MDVGQGSATVMAQLTAETLGLPTGQVRVSHADTDTTPYDTGTLGSRSTFHVGNAVVAAAEAVRARLLEAAAADARRPGRRPRHATRASVLVRGGGPRVSFRDVMVSRIGVQAGHITEASEFTPFYVPPDLDTGQSARATAFWMSGAAGADVEVDTETGHVTVTRLVVVGDAGRTLNPELVRTQLTGGASCSSA